MEHNLCHRDQEGVGLGKADFVDFYATWCGPCKMLEETFADTRVKGLLQQTTCLRIDVDQNQGDALRFKVSSIPRLLVLSPDGRKVLWDGVGYRDPDTFAPELSEALHVKTPVAAAPISTPEPPALASVDAAVEKGVLAQLKVNHPEVAKEGLRLLVQKLGVYKESDLAPVAAMLEKAGRDALPALVDGMADKTLAVRVGAYKVAQAILAKTGQKPPPYDPWAPVSTRISALGIWRAKLSS